MTLRAPSYAQVADHAQGSLAALVNCRYYEIRAAHHVTKEIANKLRMPVPKVEEILGVVQDPQALEDISGDDDTPSLLRFVADPNAPCPLERTVDRELREKVEKTLKVLSRREEEIIRLRFGIGREMPYTLEEIGRVMSLSRERVRQIEATALKKIQQAEDEGTLREFLT